MLQPGESLEFKYKGFLQEARLKINSKSHGDLIEVSMVATVKLPILSKIFYASSFFCKETSQWKKHVSLSEDPKNSTFFDQLPDSTGGSYDPLQFFLYLHTGGTPESKVALGLTATKHADIEVEESGAEIFLKRKEKDQALKIRRDSQGIESLSVTVPLLGDLELKRVHV